MESFERKGVTGEPTLEQLQAQFKESYLGVVKILREHALEENPYRATVSATTVEADEHKKYGRLTIDTFSEELFIELKELSYSNTMAEPNTTERYLLSTHPDTGQYILGATGKHPNVIDDTVRVGEVGEDEFGVMVPDVSREFHPATPDEVQRFTHIVALGAWGDFTTTAFELEYQQLVTDTNK